MVSYLPSWVVSADGPNNFNFQSICSESKYKIPRELDTDSIVLEFEQEFLLKGSVKKILILGLVGLCDAILTSSLRSRENKDLTAIAGSEYGSRIYISNSNVCRFFQCNWSEPRGQGIVRMHWPKRHIYDRTLTWRMRAWDAPMPKKKLESFG